MVDFFLNFWRTLGAHAPFLMLVLPMIGGGLSFASGLMSVDLARRTALTNTLLSCVAAVALVASFRLADRPAWQPPQMVSSLPWVSFPSGPPPAPRAEWRLTTGVDGVALPLLALLPFITLASVLTLAPDDSDTAMQFPCLLIWQATLVGVLVVQDVMLWSTFLLSSVVLPVVLMGQWGGERRREAARALALLSTGAALFTILGAFGAMVSLAWIVLGSPRLAESLPLTFDLTTGVRALRMILGSLDEAKAAWSSDRVAIAPFLLGGMALSLPLPPWRAVYVEAARQAPPAARLLFPFALLGIGTSIVLRLAMPLFGNVLTNAPLSLLCGLAALAAAFSGPNLAEAASWSHHDSDEEVSRRIDGLQTTFAIVTGCLAAAGYFSGVPAIEAGGVVLVINGLLALAIARLVEPKGPGWSAGVLGVAFLPPFGGFSGTWLLVSRLWMQGSPSPGMRWTAGIVLGAIAILMLRSLAEIVGSCRKDFSEAPRAVPRLPASVWALAGAMGVASAVLGLASSYLARRVISALLSHS